MNRLLKIFLILGIFACSHANAQEAAPKDSAKLSDGYIYVHTARNAPIFLKDGKEFNASAGELIKAGGISVKCDSSQVVTLVFSNRLVLYARGPAEFSIEEFSQEQPFEMDFSDIKEPTTSLLNISVKSGIYYLSSPTPRATSRMVLKTPFGNFEPRSEQFKLSCLPEMAELDVFQGQSIFKALDGKADFIQQKEAGLVEKSHSKEMYPLKINTLTLLQEENEEDNFSLCKMALSSIFFDFDKSGKKIKVERLTPKDFLIKRTKYDYRW